MRTFREFCKEIDEGVAEKFAAGAGKLALNAIGATARGAGNIALHAAGAAAKGAGRLAVHGAGYLGQQAINGGKALYDRHTGNKVTYDNFINHYVQHVVKQNADYLAADRVRMKQADAMLDRAEAIRGKK